MIEDLARQTRRVSSRVRLVQRPVANGSNHCIQEGDVSLSRALLPARTPCVQPHRGRPITADNFRHVLTPSRQLLTTPAPWGGLAPCEDKALRKARFVSFRRNDSIRPSIHNECSELTKITTHLDHIRHRSIWYQLVEWMDQQIGRMDSPCHNFSP